MKKFKKIFLAAMPLAALSVTIPVVTTSCSSSESNTLGVVKFNSTQKVKTRNGATPTTMEVVDPNLNEDAMAKAIDTFKKRLDVATLQKDFDRVLTKFFKVSEYDGNNLEAEIMDVKVVSVDKNNLTAQLEVKYDVEVDNENQETNNYEIQNKTLNLKPSFATTTEMQKIIRMLNGDDQENGTLEIDVEDLKELYVGDPGDNEKSIFEQAEIITTESKYGGLLGYAINVSDLQYTKTKKGKATTPDLSKTEIFAPSAEIKDFYVPNIPQTVLSNGADLTFDYDKIKNKTGDEIIKGLNGTSSDNTNNVGSSDYLISLLKNPNSIVDNTMIQSVKATDNSALKYIDVLVQLNIDGMPTLINLAISYDWLKSAPTTSNPSNPENGANGNGGSTGETGQTGNGGSNSNGSGSALA